MSSIITKSLLLPAALCTIFRRALITKPDDRTVKVQAADLLSAFGPTRCKQEFGVDLERVEARMDHIVAEKITQLETEVEELRGFADLGFQDAKRKLKAARKELRAVQSGELRPKPLVRVLAGKLRKLLADVDNLPRQTEPTEAVAEPKAVVKRKSSES